MAKFYGEVALLLPYNVDYVLLSMLLPKGSFYAEILCIKFPCVRFVQKIEYMCTLAYNKGNILCQLL